MMDDNLESLQREVNVVLPDLRRAHRAANGLPWRPTREQLTARLVYGGRKARSAARRLAATPLGWIVRLLPPSDMPVWDET